MRRLVVNADDFGHSAEVDAGVVEAHERGIVTSASLMVLRPAAREAALYARRTPSLSVGLHVDLGEWAYEDGEWAALYATADVRIPEAVAHQLEAFRELTGTDPTHLDSHQHAHLREPAMSVVSALGEDLGVPVRRLSLHARYCGDFYGQTETGEPRPDAVTVAALIEVIRRIGEGTTELCCHPAAGAVQGSSYGHERVRELEALCDPAVRAAVVAQGITLVPFGEVMTP